MVPVSPPVVASENRATVGPIAEVERDAFTEILRKQGNQPLVLERFSRFTGFTYVTRYAGCWFVLKLKKGHDFSRQAEVVPVKRFFQSFGMNTV